ncbi:MAG: TonB-dependent receptor [Bacteroidales bacterium]|nr:TonB-dependent receptor [Bacteroidales bacterium]
MSIQSEMRTVSIFLFILLFASATFSQKVKVIDETNSQPIENVLIFNNSKTVFTNSEGVADLSEFKKDEKILFKHDFYEEKYLTFKNLKETDYMVVLEQSVLNINEVVISASHWEQNKNEVPNRINIISKNKIALNNAQTSADLLKLSGEVFIQKSQLGGGSPMIRGFSANRVLIVVDGVRMNNAIFRSGNLQNVISIDANSIENSEIIFGPGSVVYGSDALGGVMDFHSLRAKYTTSEKTKFAGNTMFRFSSANTEKTGHLDFSVSKKRFSSVTSLSYSDFDDLIMGNIGNESYTRPEYVDIINGQDIVITNSNKNIQKYSGYKQLNVLQKLRFKPNKYLDINYGFYYSKTSDIPRYDRLIQYSGNQLKYAQWYYGPQEWMMNNISFFHSRETKLFSESKLIFAYQDFKESRHDRKFGKDEIRKRYENVKAYSVNLDFEKEIKQNSFLFYGAEAVTNKIYSSGIKLNVNDLSERLTSSRYPDNSDYSTFAAYISYKNNLSDIFTLNTGLRYNRVYAFAELDTMFFDFPFQNIDFNTGALNGSFGLVYRPETWQFSFNVSSGFRAPNIDDMAKVFDSEPGSVVVPNSELTPEFAYNTDIGIVKLINKKIKVDAAVFYTFLDDALIRKDFTFNGADSIMYDGELSKVQAIVNADNAVIYGFQIAFFAELLDKLSVSSNYNYTRGYDSENMPLRHVAPSFGTTHLLFKTEKFKADLFAEYNAEISFENLAESEVDKPHIYASDLNGNPFSPSWYTINLNTLFKINKVFSLKAGVENIFNMRYRPYSSGIVAPGRNFIFSLKASF